MLSNIKIIICISLLFTISFNAMTAEFKLNKLNKQKSSFLVDKIKQQEPIIHEQNWKLQIADIENILSAGINQSIQINDFPIDAIEINETKLSDSVIFKRYQIFAPSAHVYHVNKTGMKIIDFSTVRTYISVERGIGLMVNPKTGEASGYYNKQGVSLEIKVFLCFKKILKIPMY